jgi:hypothetical protein
VVVGVIGAAGGAHAISIELASVILPVIPTINFKASRREINPS